MFGLRQFCQHGLAAGGRHNLNFQPRAFCRGVLLECLLSLSLDLKQNL